ncbi:hypothetical protein C1645_824844 [Glomus cerebriforme]|uniref:Uncharacterized protein n=1 Tax=Glomus cerebriforme TaxID=658196 RepID=A0A397SU09_9GLOM|nr:hypothetical protein C1645_824844 [Glomus cerebriforme]
MKSKSRVVINIEPSELFEVEECGIDEIKLHVSIDKKDKTISTKALTIQPVKYTNVVEKINTFVQKALRDENIKQYKITEANKKMAVIVVIENSENEKKKLIEKHSSKIPNNKHDSPASEEEKVTSRPKKKKKTHTIREDDLTKEERT